MIFRKETDYNSVSAEGYRISMARLGDGRVAYSPWFRGNPVCDPFVACAGEPKDRESAFFKAKEACEADHRANGGTIDRPNI
jgi:hypothetical protein